MKNRITQTDIKKLFKLLNEELKKLNTKGEIYLVGGAVMCLVFNTRASTKDIDGFFKPAKQIRQAAARIANHHNLANNWLNDAVKGFLSDKGTFDRYLDLSNLSIFAAQADYLLAMKCLAARIGKEFYDIEDIRYLLRHLNIESYKQACQVITKFYPLKLFPQKTLHLLEELTGKPA